jgi:anti-sigma-K factor RskA
VSDKKNDDVSNLSGAYALNALDADEASAFEAEIERSEQTRYEVTELRDTAVLLGLAVTPVEPRPELKANIMALIATTPQLPVEETAHEVAPVQPSREFSQPSGAAETRAQSRWFARPAVILTSMAAAAALIVGGVVVSTNVRDTQEQNLAVAKYAQINAADDAERIVADVTDGGTATVTWSSELSSAAVTVDDVATLPSDKIYELWYIGSDGPRAAGTFSTDADGDAWTVLEGEMKDGDTIGVTVEPAGGSEQPTTTPVVAVATA